MGVVMAALLAAAAPARATEDAQAEARKQFQEGEQHFAARRFHDALRSYEAGYAAVPRSGFLLNIGQCHRRMGNLEKAKLSFQKFLLVAPDSPHRTELEGLIAEIDQVLTAVPEDKQTSAPSPQPSPLVTAPTPPAPAVAPRGNSRWWLWAGVAAAVAGGTAAAFAFAPSPAPSPVGEGSLGTLRR